MRNTTYNTHDEVRWFDQESLIYISGLNDMDAITGNDDRFINAILDSADALSPRFIALANSPIPFLNGTDFDGIAKVITGRTGIPCFYVSTNAMGDYASGASKAFEAYVRQIPRRSLPSYLCWNQTALRSCIHLPWEICQKVRLAAILFQLM